MTITPIYIFVRICIDLAPVGKEKYAYLHLSRNWNRVLAGLKSTCTATRRGGVRRRLVGGRGRRGADEWKVEAAKMKLLVKRKKEACWRKFCEEAGARKWLDGPGTPSGRVREWSCCVMR